MKAWNDSDKVIIREMKRTIIFTTMQRNEVQQSGCYCGGDFYGYEQLKVAKKIRIYVKFTKWEIN